MFDSGKKGKKYFIFNINSAGVSGALVYFDSEKNLPMIEYSTQSEIQISENTSAENFKKESEKSLKKVVAALSNYINITGGVSNVASAFVFLASPWVRKNIHNLVDERIQPFMITEQYLENFLEKGGQMRENEDLLQAEIISLKANGYTVNISDITGKEVTKLDISLMDSYMNTTDKKLISEVIKETFSFIDISYSAFLPVLFSQIKKIYDITDDFAFMDFTGEVMEFGVYQNGEIQDITSVQSGKNKIIRQMVAEGIAADFNDGQYLFSLYLQKQLDMEHWEKVSKLVEKDISEITMQIEKEFSEHKNFHIPKKVFIVSAGDINYLLKDFSIFKETYFIGKSLLKNFAQASEDKYFDNFLALEAEYIFEK